MTTTDVHAHDAMQFVNDQDAATIERFIDRLEFRGSDPTFVGYRDAYLNLIDLPSATTVLDVGCGTGVVPRAIAAREDFDGTIVGIDQSPAFITAAVRLAADDGVGDRVEWLIGDAHELNLPAGSFDVAVAHTLISHVRDPLTVLTQTARVLRPGGRMVIFDGDYASLTFGCADPRTRPGSGDRTPIDDHELAPSHAGDSAPASDGGAPPGCDPGPRVRRGRLKHLLPQPRRNLCAPRLLERQAAGSSRRHMARRPAPLSRRRHILRRLQLLHLHRTTLILRAAGSTSAGQDPIRQRAEPRQASTRRGARTSVRAPREACDQPSAVAFLRVRRFGFASASAVGSTTASAAATAAFPRFS